VPSGNVLVPMLNEGELAVLYCFVFLFFAAAGSGAWSVDAALRRATADASERGQRPGVIDARAASGVGALGRHDGWIG